MSNICKVKMDFQSDWKYLLKKEIESMGYAVDPNLDSRGISITYFNIQRRRIPSVKRKLIISNELSCPTAQTEGLELIKKKVVNGDDLVPHQSTRLDDPNYDDSLLNDWDIHHLHLGINIQSNGYVDRTGPVLFARVTNDTFYMIDVLEHGIGYKPWIKKRLLEIIHNNWPQSIAHCRLKGIESVEFDPTDEDIGKARDANINIIYQMDDGTIYAPIGGGVMTSGISSDAVQDTNRYIHYLRHIEKYVKDNIDNLASDAKHSGVQFDEEVHFKLVALSNNKISIYEQNSGALFNIPVKQ